MALFTSVASAATGSISGTVTEFGTGTPVFGAQVCAFPSQNEFEEPTDCVFSGPTGAYSLSQLPADEYLVAFLAKYLNYIPQYYLDADEASSAKLVTLGEGEALTEKDAHLKVAAKIEGTVTNALTEAGIEGVEVCALAAAGGSFAGCGVTNFEGDYSIIGLAAGEYIIRFAPEFAPGYLTQFYDHVGDEGEAKAVTVAPGEVRKKVDAGLGAGATVAGRVSAANGGAPLAGVEVCALHVATKAREGCAKTIADGSYAIHGLPSGSYAIAFSEEHGPPFVDEFETRYYDGVPSFAEAAAVALTAPQTRSGIDARLLRNGEALIVAPTIPLSPGADAEPGPPSQPKKPLRCKTGFVKKRVHDKARCVKKKKHRHRHGRHRSGRG